MRRRNGTRWTEKSESWSIWKRREICFLVIANPTTLPADVTGVLLTRPFAQPALTWVLSLCIIYSPRFDRRVFVFGTAMTLRDTRSLAFETVLWLFRTGRFPSPDSWKFATSASCDAISA